MEANADVVFEASWEVCNKVGGIYTVIISKAALMKERAKDYYLIGPYFEKKAKAIFIEEEPPQACKNIFDQMKSEGIICHYGKWDIKGEPNTILIDFQEFAKNKDGIKKMLWEQFQVDSLDAGWEFEEPMVWSFAAAKIIEQFVQHDKRKVVAHFHEWLSAAGLLYLKDKIPTVFTTHATTLGRTIAASGEPLYDMLDGMDCDAKAREYGVTAKHLIEKAAAHNATVFTTVSEITSMEAEKILGKKPEVLVLNGLDISKFPTFEEVSIKHRQSRERIREFISYYFFPYYFFDLEQTLTFFIVGRYEFKNKGIDIFIKALARLNDRMKAEDHKKTIIAFFWIPRDVLSTRAELVQNKINFDTVKHFVDRHIPEIERSVMGNIFLGSTESFNDERNFCQASIFSKKFLSSAKKLKINFVKEGNPPISTHYLAGEDSDVISQNLIQTGLDNKQDDRVKVIFYPIYLSGVDGLLDLSYYDAIVGCHLGLFPSYYEPWGYTPLESAALGVPSLTTDLGGFGRWLISQKEEGKGIKVLRRFRRPEEDTINEFAEHMYNFCQLSQNGRVKEKIAAKNTANLADWRILIDNYTKAHNLALERFGKR